MWYGCTLYNVPQAYIVHRTLYIVNQYKEYIGIYNHKQQSNHTNGNYAENK